MLAIVLLLAVAVVASLYMVQMPGRSWSMLAAHMPPAPLGAGFFD
jgi:hypothetical protein